MGCRPSAGFGRREGGCVCAEDRVGENKDVELEQVRAWLQLRLKELTHGVQANMEALMTGDSHHLADLEEMAADVGADGAVFEHFRSSADTIAQIERALRRIDEGAFSKPPRHSGEAAVLTPMSSPLARMNSKGAFSKPPRHSGEAAVAHPNELAFGFD